MLIITQSYNNNVTGIQTFSSEREAIEHFLQIVSEEEGTKVIFFDDVFKFQMIDGSFGTSITYEGGGEDLLTVQLFGVENINKYVKNWVLRVYLESGGCKYFNIKDKNEKEANNEAKAIMRDMNQSFILEWTLMPKYKF
jgi:hypothetical protein